jgi:hypothetical protein
MTQGKKIWLGILSFLPIIFTVILLVYVFTTFIPEMIRLDGLEHDDEQAISFFSNFLPFIILAILSSLLMLGLKIYFIFHAVSNEQVRKEERIVWILLFIFMGAVAFPIYWIIRILKEPKPVSNFIRE